MQMLCSNGVKLRLDFAVADQPSGNHKQCCANNPQPEEPTSPVHFWPTNRTNIPTAINRARRVPATSEITQCRLSMRLFDPTPFCAAPRPNQKRSLSIARTSLLASPLHMGSVSVLSKPNYDPHKTVPIPHCLRAASSILCHCNRTGLLVADRVCPGHFRGKFHLAPSERKVRSVEYSSSTDANNAGELTAARLAPSGPPTSEEVDRRLLS